MDNSGGKISKIVKLVFGYFFKIYVKSYWDDFQNESKNINY